MRSQAAKARSMQHCCTRKVTGTVHTTLKLTAPVAVSCLCQWVPCLSQAVAAQAQPPLNSALRVAGSLCSASKPPGHALSQRLRGTKQRLSLCCSRADVSSAVWVMQHPRAARVPLSVASVEQ